MAEMKSRNIGNNMTVHWSFVGSDIHYVGVCMGSTYAQACETFQKIQQLIAAGDLETKYRTLHACEMICVSELSATHGPALDMAVQCNNLANDIVLAWYVRNEERIYSRRTVFVSHIRRDADERDIRAVFESCGPVAAVKLAFCTRKGVLKGNREYGHVRFETDSGASNAIRTYHGKYGVPIAKPNSELIVEHAFV
jgi:hypothetical protein